MHSRVGMEGCSRRKSTTALSSSSRNLPSGPTAGGGCGLDFLFLCWPAAESSVALRFLLGLVGWAAGVTIEGVVRDVATGLVARLPADVPFGAWDEEAAGLVARTGALATTADDCAKGLVARPPFPRRLGLGALGLVARFATTTWPPWLGTGDVAREFDVDGTEGCAGAAVGCEGGREAIGVARDGRG